MSEINEVPQYWKTISHLLIGCLPLLIILYGIFDAIGFFLYGDRFTEFTVSKQIHLINSQSGGGIGALSCLILGILICHFFIR